MCAGRHESLERAPVMPIVFDVVASLSVRCDLLHSELSSKLVHAVQQFPTSFSLTVSRVSVP